MKISTPIKCKMADLQPLLTFICVISGKSARWLDHYYKTKCEDALKNLNLLKLSY